MFKVQDDWIKYEAEECDRAQLQAVPVRRVAVRGGAACSQRIPVVGLRPRAVPQRAVAPSIAPAAGPRPAPARLRLTRRGRVVLIVMPALLALSGALLAAAPGVAEAAPHLAPRTVLVGTGDTLWTIAERVAPQVDPRTMVAAIERANGLQGASIDAGDVLRLPTD